MFGHAGCKRKIHKVRFYFFRPLVGRSPDVVLPDFGIPFLSTWVFASSAGQPALRLHEGIEIVSKSRQIQRLVKRRMELDVMRIVVNFNREIGENGRIGLKTP